MKFIPLTNTELSDIEIKKAQSKSKRRRKPSKAQWRNMKNVNKRQ